MVINRAPRDRKKAGLRSDGNDTVFFRGHEFALLRPHGLQDLD